MFERLSAGSPLPTKNNTATVLLTANKETTHEAITSLALLLSF